MSIFSLSYLYLHLPVLLLVKLPAAYSLSRCLHCAMHAPLKYNSHAQKQGTSISATTARMCALYIDWFDIFGENNETVHL